MNDESSRCQPLDLTCRIGDFPIGNIPLTEHQRHVLGSSGLAAHPHAWLDPGDIAAFLASDALTLADSGNLPLAWRGGTMDTRRTLHASASFLIRHPWDLLRANEQYVAALAESVIEGAVHPAAVVEGVLRVGTGTRILPGVFIEGNVVIGADCRIGPNCYLRGNTSIGDRCHIGQSVEIKNSLILSNTNVGHLSYVGDSVLGKGVNFGAGTITSNFRHDGANHRSVVAGVLVDTGRRKFGAIIGDGVHTGIHTAIYPGRKIWPGATTRPGEIVQRDIVR